MDNTVKDIVNDMTKRISGLFDGEIDVILFGSRARGDFDEYSDVDILYLVDASREEIAKKNLMVGSMAGDLLLDYDVLVSPFVENRTFYNENIDAMPFFVNVNKEGIKING